MPAMTIEEEAKAALRAYLKPPRMTDEQAKRIADGYAITATRITREEDAREYAESNGGTRSCCGFFGENLVNDDHVMAMLISGDFMQLAEERERILEETTQQILEAFK